MLVYYDAVHWEGEKGRAFSKRDVFHLPAQKRFYQFLSWILCFELLPFQRKSSLSSLRLHLFSHSLPITASELCCRLSSPAWFLLSICSALFSCCPFQLFPSHHLSPSSLFFSLNLSSPSLLFSPSLSAFYCSAFMFPPHPADSSCFRTPPPRRLTWDYAWMGFNGYVKKKIQR